MSSDKQQKQSKNIKGAGSSKSFASQNIPTSTTITVGDREYITFPKLIKEQKAIFASQVTIPSLLSRNTLGFLGPLVSEGHLEKCVKFFPCYHTTKPIANKIVSSRNAEDSVQRDAFQLDFITDSFRPFRSCPTLDKSYLAWLTKVEKKKASFWKESGIFDLIQMSKLGFSYCQPLLYPASLQLILQGTDLKGTKAQLTTDPIQKKAQTSWLARRATPSPSEACDISEFSGFILSPLGHHNHYKYRHFSHENGQRRTDRNPGIETLETNSENSE
ncbi:hypothetical protein KIW84_051692 [Lathyrus oleraceus]|uniref:Uncharacterized protein n=1 Tax=Pisum sativum TaxID=3888 RepID=A0A9D4WN21_PEA|nr:hypothetical protein KIW84_051692 [Pisum sativum]